MSPRIFVKSANCLAIEAALPPSYEAWRDPLDVACGIWPSPLSELDPCLETVKFRSVKEEIKALGKGAAKHEGIRLLEDLNFLATQNLHQGKTRYQIFGVSLFSLRYDEPCYVIKIISTSLQQVELLQVTSYHVTGSMTQTLLELDISQQVLIK